MKYGDYIKAGEIAKKVKQHAKDRIKKGMLLREIADEVEEKIIQLGGKPAFPIGLCINDTAAHYTPIYNDETKTSGLLKIDLGVHVNGAIADTAFSLDLGDDKEFDLLIKSSDKALENAINAIKNNPDKVKINEIGNEIHKAITSFKFSPIRNLSGHELGSYKIHAGLTIPNYDNNNLSILPKGAYAIEPFSTSGLGLVYDGKPSEIYRLEQKKGVRDRNAREILKYIEENYNTLPFCSRWLVKQFGTRALISLKFLENSDIIHRYAQLIEKSHKPVSQSEHTILVKENEVIVTT